MRRDGRQNEAVLMCQIPQALIIVVPNLFAFYLDLFSGFKLSIEKRCKNIRWQEAGTDIHPCVLVDLPAKKAASISSFLSNNLGTFNVLRTIDNESAAFTAREVLGLMKTQRRKMTESP